MTAPRGSCSLRPARRSSSARPPRASRLRIPRGRPMPPSCHRYSTSCLGTVGRRVVRAVRRGHSTASMSSAPPSTWPVPVPPAVVRGPQVLPVQRRSQCPRAAQRRGRRSSVPQARWSVSWRRRLRSAAAMPVAPSPSPPLVQLQQLPAAPLRTCPSHQDATSQRHPIRTPRRSSVTRAPRPMCAARAWGRLRRSAHCRPAELPAQAVRLCAAGSRLPRSCSAAWHLLRAWSTQPRG
mmetsp:Transcript_43439/g.130296  ORF Transcript_43439/g.130296 Transcript_43439/m.130296 type:complete len:237 (-) Transcript_43439:279-989(-)